MEWSQSLSVGVDLIDDQHKELIARVNSFYSSIKTSNKADEILKILTFMEDYVITHFRDEEQLQMKYRYPVYNDHKALHKQFITDIAKIKKDIKDNGFNQASALIVGATLSNWLINHISKEDKKLGAYINSL